MTRRCRRSNGPGQSLIGRELGLNASQPYSIGTEILDTCNATGVGWLRTTIEYGFHANQAAADAAIAAAGASGLWPDLLPYKAQWDAARVRGVRVVAVVQGCLSWVRGADRSDGGNQFHQAPLPSKRSYFADFVRQVALSGVDAIEFFNEPNFKNEYWLGPDHPRAAFPGERVDDYVILMRQCYARVKGDPLTAHIQVGIGAPSIVGHELLSDPNWIHATLWYGRLFAGSKADDRTTPVSISGAFDWCGVHPYADINSDAGPLAWGASWLSGGDAAYWHGMASVYRQRAHVIAAGHADKKFWATECGAPTASALGSGDLIVTEAKQATWLHQYIQAWHSQAASGFGGSSSPMLYGGFTGPLIYYQWRDKSDGVIAPTDREGYFGVLRYDGSPKPALAALTSDAKLIKGYF